MVEVILGREGENIFEATYLREWSREGQGVTVQRFRFRGKQNGKVQIHVCDSAPEI